MFYDDINFALTLKVVSLLLWLSDIFSFSPRPEYEGFFCIKLQHFLILFTRKKLESNNKNLLLKLVIEHTNEIQFEQRWKTTTISAEESREMSGDIKLHVWSRPLVNPFLHLGEWRHADKQSFDVWVVCSNVRAKHTAQVVANTGEVDITPWQLQTFTGN